MRLYFAGARHRVYHAYIRERGGHFLLSYVNERTPLERLFSEGAREIFVDSGAFTAHRKGIEIDCDAYCDFLNTHEAHIGIAAQIDTIPGRFGEKKTPQQLADAPRLSWENYTYMRGKIVRPDLVLSIFHQGEDFYWLENMLAERVPYIGISPANDRTEVQKEAWMARCWQKIERSMHPDVKTHAFGMTNVRLLEQFPFTSADSTTWLINAVYGAIMTSYGIVSISERKQLVNPAHLLNQSKAIQDKVREEIEAKGTTLETLQQSLSARVYFNVDFFIAWEKNYQLKRKPQMQRLLWV